eukprot:TRINITY_DN2611_c0_g1_i9.p1 TRINITY_DN2611_c0_g1~~TRINITY_DN2611_c0_g1_i9.p1  ORF type:complete len:236 (+),score=57.99 TRINITY_DN2611_c0_g1_i9:139-846(+)
MLRSLVGSEMCIRDRYQRRVRGCQPQKMQPEPRSPHRLLRGAASWAVAPLRALFAPRSDEDQVGSGWFVEYFGPNHGEQHPHFLDMSWQDALAQSKSEKKLLLVYLHSPMHELSHEFCGNVLGSEPICEYIQANMLCWAGSAASSDGLEAYMWCKASGFPAIGIVAPINYRGGALQMVLVALLQGKFSQDDLMVTMIKMTQAFEPVLAATLRDSVARDLERDLCLLYTSPSPRDS